MFNFKKILSGVAGATLLFSTAWADQVELKLAHQWPQNEDDYVIAAAMEFVEEVEERSNGEIDIRVFPAQSLVKASETHTALKAGAIDLAVYPYIYSAGAIPQMNLLLLPGLWKSHDEVFNFRNTEAWKQLEEKANAYGFKTLAWIQIGGGFASATKPIHKPADVEGSKVRAAGRFMEYALQQAGASTVSMPSSDAYGAMQRGLLDAVLTSSSSLGAYRIYEVADHYVSPEDYAIYYTVEPIAISMEAWEKLTPKQQKILVEAGKSVEEMALKGAKAEDRRVAKLFAENGVNVEKLTLEDWQKWQEHFSKYSFPSFKENVPGGAALLEKVLDEKE